MRTQPKGCHINSRGLSLNGSLITQGNLLVNSGDPVSLKIGETVITNSKAEALLCVTIDSEIIFETHILNNMYNKASQ